MSIQTATNMTSPATMKWATSDTDPFDRATHLAAVAEDLDAHDHSAGQGVAVARGAFTAATPVTVSSATALTVARTGTNYALQVDTATASSATGLKITASAAAAGLALAVISSGTDEGLTLNAKGAGAIVIGTVSTGAITLGRATTVSAALTVSTGGIIVAGNSTITGTLGGVTTLTTSGAINSQTISAAASFTGTLATVGNVTVGGDLIQTVGNGARIDALGAGTFQALRLGSSSDTTVSNYNVASDTSGLLILNALTGQTVDVRIANTTVAQAAAAGLTVTGSLSCTSGMTVGNGLTVTTGGVLVSAGGVNVTGAAVFSTTLTQTAGNYYQGDTANAKQTLGHTINQGASGDEILSLKASFVAHGITDRTETDTYGHLNAVGNDGALAVNGSGEATYGLYLSGASVTDDTTKSTAGIAPTLVQGLKKSGAGVTAPGANANVFVVQSNTSTKFIVDAEGEVHCDGASTAMVSYDEHDDVALVRSVELARGGPGLIRSQWDDFVRTGRDDLVALGIIGADGPDGARGLLNITGLQRLHNGAIWQLHTRLAETEARLVAAEARLALTGG